jgi:hypothetical protein
MKQEMVDREPTDHENVQSEEGEKSRQKAASYNENNFPGINGGIYVRRAGQGRRQRMTRSRRRTPVEFAPNHRANLFQFFCSQSHERE